MVSVIIPAYDEEKALPDTLHALCFYNRETTRSLQSTAGVPIALAVSSLMLGFSKAPYPSRFLMTAPKGRASQMNAGAAEAGGEWLLFLHADTVLPSGAIQRQNEMEADQAIQAGGFMHQFSGDDWRLRAISFLDNFRCTRSRIIYDDQALFVRRSLFQRLGGFPNQPILEDVAFCERLIKATEPLLLFPPVITDARKFLKMGVWRSFVRVLLIILHVEYRLPTLPRTFFQDVRSG